MEQKGRGGKQEEIFVCQRQQREKVLVIKNILSVWFLTCHVVFHTTELQSSSLWHRDLMRRLEPPVGPLDVGLWMHAKVQ